METDRYRLSLTVVKKLTTLSLFDLDYRHESAYKMPKKESRFKKLHRCNFDSIPSKALKSFLTSNQILRNLENVDFTIVIRPFMKALSFILLLYLLYSRRKPSYSEQLTIQMPIHGFGLCMQLLSGCQSLYYYTCAVHHPRLRR